MTPRGGHKKLQARLVQPRPQLSFHRSPDELRTDLPDARIAGTRDVPEGFVADVPARVDKLRVVEDVEEFASNLEMRCFSDGNDLSDSEIGVVESGTVKESPVRCTERSTVSTHQDAR